MERETEKQTDRQIDRVSSQGLLVTGTDSQPGEINHSEMTSALTNRVV